MKKINTLVASFLCVGAMALSLPMPLYGAVHTGKEQLAQSGKQIRVLLAKEVPGALLEAKGPYKVIRIDNHEVLSSGSSGKRFVVQAISDGLRWGEEYPDVYEISVVPKSAKTSMYVNGIQYKGALSIYFSRGKTVTIVNDVGIEDFLKSTLVGQYDANASQEAKASLVIIERTIAHVNAMKNKSNKPWDVVASECNYLGYGVTKSSELEKIVDQTKDIVLTKDEHLLPEIAIQKEKVEELALKGHDAKAILHMLCPGSSLSTR